MKTRYIIAYSNNLSGLSLGFDETVYTSRKQARQALNTPYKTWCYYYQDQIEKSEIDDYGYYIMTSKGIEFRALIQDVQITD